MKQMIARKAFRYGTRALVAGDAFPARDRDARILEAIGRARYETARAVAAVPAPDPAVIAHIDTSRDSREDLREKARALGVPVDGRWSVPRLAEAIEAAENGGS